MRYLLSLMVLFLFNTGQSQILLLMEDGIAGADTIPSQFTFADVTDAAVSSYNQGYIVVAGCDSARFYTNGTDSLKLGALGTYDVSEIWADVGDTVYMGNVASASNSTTTNKVLYSSNGTPLDTFSVTTVAGGGFTPASLSPVLYLVHDAGITKDTNNKVTSWTDGTYDFTMADTSITPLQTDSSIYFQGWGTYRRLDLADAGGNPFDIGTGDMSLEVWIWLDNDTNGGNIFEKDGIWTFQDVTAAEYNQLQFYAHDSTFTNEAMANSEDLNYSGAWHHFIFSWDRDGLRNLAIDSVSHYSSDVDFTDLQSYDFNSTDPTRIGGIVNGKHIAVIRFYNYPLNPTQIKQLYEYGRE